MQKQDNIEAFHMAAERAVDELRRQMGVLVQEDSDRLLAAYPAEFLTAEALAFFRSLPRTRLTLLITGARARSIGMDTGAKAVQIEAQDFTLVNIMAIVDPLADQKRLPQVNVMPATSVQHLLLTLAKQASLLPALLVIEGDSSLRVSKELTRWVSYSMALEAIRRYVETPQLEIIETAQAKLPLEGAEDNRLISFRTRHGASVHLALIVGDISGEESPLVRIHSSCVTGDILGSLRCDCGDQLQLALSHIIEEGSGILIYLHQEGRGIGITNKLRAYKLQEQGVDTYEANLMLGYEEDERDFSIAAAILKKLNIGSIRMLTNNPHKMKSLEKQGIKISERLPLIAESGAHNHAYISAKAKKSGHQFG
jgi:GTP cyclohydrolase II